MPSLFLELDGERTEGAYGLARGFDTRGGRSFRLIRYGPDGNRVGRGRRISETNYNIWREFIRERQAGRSRNAIERDASPELARAIRAAGLEASNARVRREARNARDRANRAARRAAEAEGAN